MLYALIEGRKTIAQPRGNAICPACRLPVIAKCGDINAWHWAHRANVECDPWWEPESEWHLAWKRMAEPSHCEVIMGCHRADILSVTGHVIELQRSPLQPSEIRARESHYRKLLWIIDASDFKRRIQFRERGDYTSFRWKHIRKWMLAIHKPMIWDLGGHKLFRVRKLYPNKQAKIIESEESMSIHTTYASPAGGWGNFVDFSSFTNWAFSHIKPAYGVRLS